MSDSFWPHGLQHTRLTFPSQSPRAYSNSCPLSQWCHPTISSSVTPFSSCPQSFPASGSFPMIGFSHQVANVLALVSASVLPMNIQGWFSLGLTCCISFQSKGLSRVFSSTTSQKHNSLVLSLLCGPTLTSVHDYWKTIALSMGIFVNKVMSLLYNMLSRFVIAFLPSVRKILPTSYTFMLMEKHWD